MSPQIFSIWFKFRSCSFFFLVGLSRLTKLRFPVILLAYGHILYSLHGLLVLFYVCFVSLREDTFQISKFFFSISGFHNIQWLPLPVSFQYNFVLWYLLASTFFLILSFSCSGVRREPCHFDVCLQDQYVDQPGFYSLAIEVLARCRRRPTAGGRLWAQHLARFSGGCGHCVTGLSEPCHPCGRILFLKFLISLRLLHLHTASQGGGGQDEGVVVGDVKVGGQRGQEDSSLAGSSPHAGSSLSLRTRGTGKVFPYFFQ